MPKILFTSETYQKKREIFFNILKIREILLLFDFSVIYRLSNYIQDFINSSLFLEITDGLVSQKVAKTTIDLEETSLSLTQLKDAWKVVTYIYNNLKPQFSISYLLSMFCSGIFFVKDFESMKVVAVDEVILKETEAKREDCL